MIKALRTFRVRPTLPAELAGLATLAHNLRWAWDPPTQELFRWADAAVWDEVGGNPVALLGRLSPERMQALVADGAFLTQLEEVRADLERYLTGPRWAQRQDPPPPSVAYFSPEFGLTGAMQTYSGGLGVLAGDHLKAASDLGLELTGVGLLYRHGYFRQHLDADGWQQERYPDLNPYSLPLRRLERDGEPAVVTVRLAQNHVACQVWKAEVGRVPLFLLDTDLPVNAPEDRTVTDKLYGGDVEHRIRQEIVLGIGGVRALALARELGEVAIGSVDTRAPRRRTSDGSAAHAVLRPATVFHSNEGHAGFLQLERIRRLVTDERLDFEQATESARSGVLFTTHTPVPAGIDVFPRELMERYFTELASECGVDLRQLMAVGQIDDAGHGSTFNMAIMGLRLSAAANGVSQLHGRVSRSMFSALWPALTTDEVPITSVTNGVHAATWVGREMSAAYDRHLSPDWSWNPAAWERVGELTDDVLWRARGRARERLVANLRDWVRRQAERRGESTSSLGWTRELFDPDALTIGFARRFAEYKRGTLLLRQPDRLGQLLLSTDRPVQLVFAGKAHPRDEIGKNIIRELVHFANSDPELRARVVFVEDYDMDLAGVLIQGVDVWLNNPRRPHEACGTSGEKAVLNGALHCSTLDGWWDEMYDGENGFTIGSAGVSAGDGGGAGAVVDEREVAHQDAADAQSVFDVLERLVVPLFYDRHEGPLPRRWLDRMRRSLATLGPRVLASRMVLEYATDLYGPIAAHAEALTAQGHARAKVLADWRTRVAAGWPGIVVEELDGDQGAAAIGDQRDVRTTVRLGDLTTDDVRVELLHGAVRADGALEDPSRLTLEPVEASHGSDGGRVQYRGTFRCASSGEYGFTTRVLAAHDDLLHDMDTGLAAWADERTRTAADT
ncbi:glycosyltransferase family 1 protein [soil metagenome]